MSGKTRLGGYTWWPADYAMDEHVALMTLEQEGIYRKLLDYAWLHGSVPADLGTMARLLGKRMTLNRLEKLWPRIAPCWIEENGRLTNGRMERERADLIAFSAERSASGRKGALVKLSRGSAWAQHKPPSPSPSPLGDSSVSAVTSGGHPKATAALARSKNDDDELPGRSRRRGDGQGMQHIGDVLATIRPKEAS